MTSIPFLSFPPSLPPSLPPSHSPFLPHLRLGLNGLCLPIHDDPEQGHHVGKEGIGEDVRVLGKGGRGGVRWGDVLKHEGGREGTREGGRGGSSHLDSHVGHLENDDDKHKDTPSIGSCKGRDEKGLQGR